MYDKIIKLGQDCYWNGSVEELVLEDDDKYAATVAIQENYLVTLKLDKQGTIVWAECDCPCIDGPYCKHVLAVFLAVRDGQGNLENMRFD